MYQKSREISIVLLIIIINLFYDLLLFLFLPDLSVYQMRKITRKDFSMKEKKNPSLNKK